MCECWKVEQKTVAVCNACAHARVCVTECVDFRSALACGIVFAFACTVSHTLPSHSVPPYFRCRWWRWRW